MGQTNKCSDGSLHFNLDISQLPLRLISDLILFTREPENLIARHFAYYDRPLGRFMCAVGRPNGVQIFQTTFVPLEGRVYCIEMYAQHKSNLNDLIESQREL